MNFREQVESLYKIQAKQGLMNYNTVQAVMPAGPSNAPIAVVGEYPSGEEYYAEHPFEGYAGDLLRTTLESVGLRPSQVYKTHLIKSLPAPGKTYKFINAKGRLTEHAKQWQALLLEEILEVKPRVIIAMGQLSLAALLEETEINNLRGTIFIEDSDYGKVKVIPTYSHIRTTYANPADSLLFAADIRKAVYEWQYHLEEGYPERTFNIDPSIEEIKDWLEEAEKACEEENLPIGFDIETSARRCTMCSISYRPDNGLVIPFSSLETDPKKGAEAWRLFAKFMSNEKIRKVGQNTLFDYWFLGYKHGVVIKGPLEDTMLAHSILYPEMPKSLKTLVSVFTREPYYKDELQKGKKAEEVGNFEMIRTYNAKDSALTLEAFYHLEKQLKDDGHWEAYRDTCSLIPAAAFIQSVGIRVDFDYLDKLRKENKKNQNTLMQSINEKVRQEMSKYPLEEAIKRLYYQEKKKDLSKRPDLPKDLLTDLHQYMVGRKEKGVKAWGNLTKKFKETSNIEKYCADYNLSEKELVRAMKVYVELMQEGMNIGSNLHTLAYFFYLPGYQPYKDRKSGNPTVNSNALDKLATGTSKRPPDGVAKEVLSLRRLEKIRSSYLNTKYDTDGRFRFSIALRGTTTDRWSSSQEVALGVGSTAQTFPDSIKPVYVADPGHLIYEMDKVSAEWVVVAFLAQDERMIEAATNPDIDAHSATAHYMTLAPMDYIKAEHKLLGASTDRESVQAAREKLRSQFPNALDNVRFIPKSMSFRQMGKKCNHALNYGLGVGEFAYQNDLPLDEAEMIHRLYGEEAYPGVPRWHEETYWRLKETRTLITPMGRKRVFHGQIMPLEDEKKKSGMLKEALSYIPQSTVTWCVNLGIRATMENQHLPYVKPAIVLNQVHDSIVFEYPEHDEDLANQYVEWLANQMEPNLTIYGRDFKILTDGKVGRRWASKDCVGFDIGDDSHRKAFRKARKLTL